MGGGAPVRVQSMTNTDTMDTRATVEQTLRLVEAGCELVRITAPDVKAAQNLYNIKNELAKHGCTVPLVADIHFNPLAAETAAEETAAEATTAQGETAGEAATASEATAGE